MVKEIEANLCFAIFGQNLKIQNGRHFWGGENFLKIAKSTLLGYPVGQKFRSYYSVSYRPMFTKSNPMQAINPINTHAKFGKDRINTFPSNERKQSVRKLDTGVDIILENRVKSMTQLLQRNRSHSFGAAVKNL